MFMAQVMTGDNSLASSFFLLDLLVLHSFKGYPMLFILVLLAVLHLHYVCMIVQDNMPYDESPHCWVLSARRPPN